MVEERDDDSWALASGFTNMIIITTRTRQGRASERPLSHTRLSFSMSCKEREQDTKKKFCAFSPLFCILRFIEKLRVRAERLGFFKACQANGSTTWMTERYESEPAVYYR